MFRGQCFQALAAFFSFAAGGSRHWFSSTFAFFLSDMQFIATQYLRMSLLLESGVDIVSG